MIEEEIPIGVDDILKRGTGYLGQNRFAFDEKQDGGSGANEDKRRLRVDGNCLYMSICVFNARDHPVEAYGECHGGINLADALLHGGFLSGVEGRKTRVHDLDTANEDVAGTYVGDSVGVPRDDAENGLGVTLLDGYGSIGDEGPVTAPAFHLGLVDDNVRPVAIERSGPW